MRTVHLYERTLERYVRRELPPEQLAVLDEHVGNCLACAQTLSEAAMTSSEWERRGVLGRLRRVR
jgi:anti-sigma factor RsiW